MHKVPFICALKRATLKQNSLTLSTANSFWVRKMLGRNRRLKSNNIIAVWDARARKAIYRAVLCNAKNGKRYSKKDLQQVAMVKLRIERDKLSWWEIKEEKDVFHLYYYPDVWVEEARKRNQETAEGKGMKDSPIFAGPDTTIDSLTEIVEKFNTTIHF